MIAILLTVALSAAAPAKPAKPTAPTTTPAAAPAPAPAEPAEGAPLDAETMAFLSSSSTTRDKDGSIRLDWSGPGGGQLKLSWDALEKRNEEVFNAEMLRVALLGAVKSFYDGDGTIDVAGTRKKLVALMAGPVDEAKASFLAAVKAEERRLFFVERAIAEARAVGEELPGVDARLVAKRLAALQSGRVEAKVLAQLEAYRNLGVGLIAYLDGDTFNALKRVRDASEGLPDMALVHALLGSLYALYGQTDAAVTSWKRSLELDPSNGAVREAILQHSRQRRQGT
jgi:tetratricopeptide (TPR) repeat protein